MSQRFRIIVLVFAYALGVVFAWGLFEYRRPTEEVLSQRRIDNAIRSDLCTRLAIDLERFEQSPHTAQRTSLMVLLSESTAVAQNRFEKKTNGEAIRYRNVDSKSVVEPCEKDAKRWLRVPTAFPELYESELAMIGGTSLAQAAGAPKRDPAVMNAGGQRVALVIGNGSYKSGPLKNPVNDAKDMGEALKSLGFNVTEVYNASLEGVRGAVTAFSEKLNGQDVGLVYYSGHGIEFNGRNYFVPVEASISSEGDIPRQAFDATEILEKMSRSNVKASIFIIDACRNAPVFSTYRSPKVGLAPLASAKGSLVAFAAGPGQLALDGNAKNSPYTSTLIEQMKIPDKKIEDVIKETARIVSEQTQGRQTPWYNSSLVGDFYFAKSN